MAFNLKSLVASVHADCYWLWEVAEEDLNSFTGC